MSMLVEISQIFSDQHFFHDVFMCSTLSSMCRYDTEMTEASVVATHWWQKVQSIVIVSGSGLLYSTLLLFGDDSTETEQVLIRGILFHLTLGCQKETMEKDIAWGYIFI